MNNWVAFGALILGFCAFTWPNLRADSNQFGRAPYSHITHAGQNQLGNEKLKC